MAVHEATSLATHESQAPAPCQPTLEIVVDVDRPLEPLDTTQRTRCRRFEKRKLRQRPAPSVERAHEIEQAHE